jgi:hypothetical protein
VRADGYEDKRVEIDFTVSQRDFSVSLTRIPPTLPTMASTPLETVDMTGAGDERSPPTRKPVKKSKKQTDDKKQAATTERKVELEIEPKVEPLKLAPKPDDKKKPVGKIDRTDTIDPFSKQ